MKVRVYTLQETLYDGEAAEIIARTTTGEIAVLPNHIPLVTTLVAAPLVIVKEGGAREEVAVKRGFLEVRPSNEIVVLVDELADGG